MLRNDSLLSDILCCDVEAIKFSKCLLRDKNTATTIIRIIVENIEKNAQWIGLMKK